MKAFLASPLAGALKVTSKFGARELGLRTRPHNGIDLAAPLGTHVLAPGPGRVVLSDRTEADEEDAGGIELVIKLDNGYHVGFAHLLTTTVGVGDRVETGEIVGGVGNSGLHTTGPHLHLTLRDPSGVRIDPEPHLPRSLLLLLVLGGIAGGAAWWAWRHRR